MRTVSLNEYLNAENVWTQRLLGLSQFSKSRNLNSLEKEFNVDKFGPLSTADCQSIQEYKFKEIEFAGRKLTDETVISIGEELFKVGFHEALYLFYNLIYSKLAPYLTEKLCELGCGYGYNLSNLKGYVYGGDFSPNAINIARRFGLNVRLFNFYEPLDYEFIESGSTIFTLHAIENVKDASLVINNLSMVRHRINHIVLFEPAFIEERSTLLGVLRNKYNRINDYCPNLLTEIKLRNDIEIVELEQDLCGFNPLHPVNFIVFKFKA